MLHASIAATTATPSANANTGSEVSTRQPPHDSVTSPVWSAPPAAPAAASAINTRNRMIRYIGFLWPRLGERGHGIGCELAGRSERRIARVRFVEPGLRGRAIGRRQRLQLAPRLDHVVAQRRRRHPRDDGAAIVADGVGTLDADQFCCAGLQAIDNAGAGGGVLRRRRR